jgi:hypothetical protein
MDLAGHRVPQNESPAMFVTVGRFEMWLLAKYVKYSCETGRGQGVHIESVIVGGIRPG